MHLSYMNDPMEGNVLKDFLLGTKRMDRSERKDIIQPYVFMKCFTSRVDYLPMWGMYGKNATGCGSVFD